MKQFRPMTRRVMVLLYLFAAALAAGGCGAQPYATEETVRETVSSRESASDSRGEAESEEDETVCVYVCGAVMRSGVYTLPAGARAAEAIACAGGLAEDADETAVNQALLLTDGQQITVPVRGAAFERNSAEDAAAPVNINTADETALMTLPGIGSVRAAEIVAYREAHGPFQSEEELVQVDGVGNALFQKIRDRITVGGQ